MTLQEKATIKILIEISLPEVYKMQICGSVAVKKTGTIKRLFLPNREFEGNT